MSSKRLPKTQDPRCLPPQPRGWTTAGETPTSVGVLASAIWGWGIRHAWRTPGLWVLAGGLVALVPVARLLSPFDAVGMDPTWSLVRSWCLPVGLIGTSLAIHFLSSRAGALELLAPRTRLQGELGTLLLAPASFWAFLFCGALTARPALPPEPWHGWQWLPYVQAHLTALGLLVLRVPASAGVRVTLLWLLAWVAPALLATTRLGQTLDAGRMLDRDPPRSWFMLPAGLLILACALLPPRAELPR